MSAFLFLATASDSLLGVESEFNVFLLKSLALLALILLNALFVAAEFAIVKVRSSQLDPLVEKGDFRASCSHHVVEHLDDYLSVTQFGITLSSIALGWLGSPFLAIPLTPFFAFLGTSNPVLIESICVVLAFAFLTYLHIVIGELVPKSLAIRHSLLVSLWVARPLQWIHSLLRPLIWFLRASANLILLKVFNVQPVNENELKHSEEDLRVILTEGCEDEDTALGREILLNALDLKHRVACDIMTPRGDVVYLDLEESFESQLSAAIESRHTRFPLCRGHIDDAVALVHIKDLLALVREGKKDLLSVKRDLHHISEMMPLEKLLRFFLSKQAHLAVVVDEYGGALGIVTLDNVLEELVGSIHDEFDAKEESEVRQINDDEFEVNGSMAIYELSELIKTDLDDSEVSTIGGFITSALGHIPIQGEQVEVGNYLATVVESDTRRVVRIHFKHLTAISSASETPTNVLKAREHETAN